MSEPEPCFEPSQIPEGYYIDSYPSDPLYSYEPAYTTGVSCADGWSNELDSEPSISCSVANTSYTFSGCTVDQPTGGGVDLFTNQENVVIDKIYKFINHRVFTSLLVVILLVVFFNRGKINKYFNQKTGKK